MQRLKMKLLVLCSVLLAVAPVFAEEPAKNVSPAGLIGLTIAELIEQAGPPKMVYAVRGENAWQDDVVFSYSGASAPAEEFYLYRDRVWQVKVASYEGVKTGDKRSVLPLVFGSSLTEAEDYSLCTVTGTGSWPLIARFNTNKAGVITGIYIYRADI
jgi:hypothetical protein